MVIGIVSRKRAEWLGSAATVAGGAVLVDTYASPALVDLVDEYAPGTDALIGVGSMPDGTDVPDIVRLDSEEVLGVLRKDAYKLLRMASKHESMVPVRDAVVNMLGIVERKSRE